MDYNKIVCYDYIEYMNDVMDPESVDLTVTSPPHMIICVIIMDINWIVN